MRNRVPLDFKHLQERIREFSGNEVSKEEFMTTLREKLANADINLAKQDVLSYIENNRELDIWSNEYFLQLVDMIVFE